jgi:hypothetical protein
MTAAEIQSGNGQTRCPGLRGSLALAFSTPLVASSFSRIDATWYFTVWTEISSRRAISSFQKRRALWARIGFD